MIKHPISYVVDNKNYTANFTINPLTPVLVEVSDIVPDDFKPILPYQFTVYKKIKMLRWDVGSPLDKQYGQVVATAVLSKCAELGIDLYAMN